MATNLNCPACGSDMRDRGMLAHYSLKPYRVCPACQGKYTVDTATKRRQLLIGLLAMITIVLATVSFDRGFPWSLATFLCGIGLLGYVGFVLSKMTYVGYSDSTGPRRSS